jgi:hypothetical protein
MNNTGAVVADMTKALDNAATALCRLRCWDPGRQVSETDKRTFFQKARTECIAFKQLYMACNDVHLLE